MCIRDRLSLNARLHESRKQMDAVRRGFFSVVPECVVSLCLVKEIETMVCGSFEIDIKFLKENTNSYDEDDEVNKWFWEVLEEFSQEDRRAYLRFTWGRSRLPLTSEDFGDHHSIERIDGGDSSYPVSHTCFFQIDLPRYTSKEILAERLRYAIHNCLAIDGDDTEIIEDEEDVQQR
eukprot:TRINITY_DN5323_c0_g1_i4.p1 TRINITY_DN5323_c0_g1~~TRINITY_DN5323_c0_g1_i4.p1  ORF type:complete len:177 (-),score=49.66 TRINITY_DN5323_c0_g1_i4:511-1041(-)